MSSKKKFRLVDAILSTVCLTLVVESVMPTAAIGNSQYFWWILLIVCFCIPYGMVAAELGTAYPSEAGMYDWVKRAFGKRWAGRVAWNYWVNFPLWISSLATCITSVLASLLNIELAWYAVLIIQLAYIWLTTFLGTKRVGESKYVVNLGTICKVAILGTLGVLGFVYFAKNGSANPITSFKDLLPDLSLNADTGLPFISIIIFNFLGFEVVGSWASDMENPKKQIPITLLVGGIIMAIFYILPATAFNFVLDSSAIDPDDMIQVMDGIFGAVGLTGVVLKTFMWIFGIMLIYSWISNIASWSFGVNEAARAAAEDGSMPGFFNGTNNEGVASNAAIVNGVVASIISIAGIAVAELVPSWNDAFSLFFCLSWITLLFSYCPLFMAFLKLRKTDSKTERVYKVPGNPYVMAFVPFVLLVAGLVFTIFGDFSIGYLQDNIPLIAGVVISFVIEEILVLRIKKEK